MASGMLQRWQGKVKAATLYLGSGGIVSSLSGIVTSRADITALSGYGAVNAPTTAALAIGNSGVNLLSSVGGSTYALAAPFLGREVTIYSAAIGDGTRKVNSSPATIQSTLAGAGFLNFSTAAVQSITLKGLSTAAWMVKDNYGSVTVTTA